jgi:hypothetical protein
MVSVIWSREGGGVARRCEFSSDCVFGYRMNEIAFVFCISDTHTHSLARTAKWKLSFHKRPAGHRNTAAIKINFSLLVPALARPP